MSLFTSKPKYTTQDIQIAVSNIERLQTMWNSTDQYIRLNTTKLTQQGYTDLTARLHRLSRNIETAQLYHDYVTTKLLPPKPDVKVEKS